MIGKINHPQVINQLKNINKYLNFTKFRWAFIMPNHLIWIKNTIKDEIKKSIKDYKYIAFGTETLFLDHIINDLFKKLNDMGHNTIFFRI